MSRSPRARSMRTAVGAALAIPLLATLGVAGGASAAPETPEEPGANADHQQPELGTRSAEVIEVDGYEFRDLNGNGELDDYEDWRLADADRIDDLVGQMTLEEQAGLMLIDTLNASCIDGERGVVPESGYEFINEQHMHRFVFRNTVAGPDEAECGEAGGGFRASTTVTPAEAATFTNSV